MNAAVSKERGKEKKCVLHDVYAYCSQEEDGCFLGNASVVSEIIMHDTGDVDFVHVDADVITLPLQKVGKSREITSKKKEYAVFFGVVRPMEQEDCCVYAVNEVLPQNSGRLLVTQQCSLARRS